MTQKSPKNPGWYTVKIEENKKMVECESKAKRSSIFLCTDKTPKGNSIFTPLPKPALNYFEIEKNNTQLDQPSADQEETILLYFKRQCWTESGRFRRICKRRPTRKPKPKKQPPMYKHIWLAYDQHSFSYKMLEESYGITARTAKKVIEAYRSNQIPHEVLDAKQLPRCGRKGKYLDENPIMEFIKKYVSENSLKTGCTIKGMTAVLNSEFHNIGDFKESKVHQLMIKAGVRYKKTKIKLIPRRNQKELAKAQFLHIKALSNAICSNKLIIFIDETYVNSHLIPKNLWFNAGEEPVVRRFPKDQRAAIIAATSLHGLETIQVVFGSVDSICFTIFVLTTYKALLNKYAGRELLFVYDNARPHIFKLSAKALNSNPFTTQPPYFPAANFIEYVFGLFKRAYRKRKLNEAPGVSLLENVLVAFSSITSRQFDNAKLEMFDFVLKTLLMPEPQ